MNTGNLAAKHSLAANLQPTHISPRLNSFLQRVWANRIAITTSPRGRNGKIYEMYTGCGDDYEISIDELKEFLLDLHKVSGRPCDQVQQIAVNCDLFHLATVDVGSVPDDDDAFDAYIELVENLGRTFFHYDRTPTCSATQRIYLNVVRDHAVEVMGWVIQNILNDASRYPGVKKAKVAGPANNRPDTIVIWLRDNDAKETVLKGIEEYQNDHRAYFGIKTPSMTQNLGAAHRAKLRGVAVAMDPSDRTVSFGKSRTRVIFAAIARTLNANVSKDQFMNDVLGDLREAGIDLRNPHLHRP